MFANNPNIAAPGYEGKANLEWIHHYKGHRLYNKLENGKWIWNYDFKVRPGEFYFSDSELNYSCQFPQGFIVIEPNVPWQKIVAPNKDWGELKYRNVAAELKRRGFDIVQFKHKNSKRILPEAAIIDAGNFRNAIAGLSRARLYIGPEGGMHHAAAAVHVPAVVLFGGFIPPQVMGYENQICLTGGAQACGNIMPCMHCKQAMENITVEEVLHNAQRLLQ